MRRSVIALVGSAAALSLLASPAQATSASAPTVWKLPAKTEILFTGASVTYGYYATNADLTYRADVVRGLAQRGITASAVVVARPGATLSAALTWRYPPGATVTVVQFVTDDFWKGTLLPVFDQQYVALLAELQAASPNTRLVCLGDWMSGWRANGVGLTSADYSVVVESECERIGGDYVDLSSIYEQPFVHGPASVKTPFGVSDRYHPNNAGHQLIADAIVSALLHPQEPEAAVVTVSHAANALPAAAPRHLLAAQGRHHAVSALRAFANLRRLAGTAAVADGAKPATGNDPLAVLGLLAVLLLVPLYLVFARISRGRFVNIESGRHTLDQ